MLNIEAQYNSVFGDGCTTGKVAGSCKRVTGLPRDVRRYTGLCNHMPNLVEKQEEVYDTVHKVACRFVHSEKI